MTTTSNNTDYKSLVLSNEHVLDFISNNNRHLRLPDWFENLKRLDNKLWAGDIDWPTTKIEQNLYNGYNIYYCLPDSGYGESYKFIFTNLDKLYRIYGEHNFLICLINTMNQSQAELFSHIFKDFFVEYRVKGHNYSFDFNITSNILRKDGIFYLDNNPEPRIITLDKLDEFILNYQCNLQNISRKNSFLTSGKIVTTRNEFEIYPSIIFELEEKILSNIGKLIRELKNKENQFILSKSFDKIYTDLNKKFKKNRYSFILFLSKIYRFISHNIISKLPPNLIGFLDLINDNNDIIIFYKKID